MMEKFTKYEKARMIGARALQIANGAPFVLKLSKKDLVKLQYNPVRIATIEFEKGVIPIDVIKPEPKVQKKAED